MSRVRKVAAVVGLLIVTALSFGKAPGFGVVGQALLERPWFPPPLLSDVVKSGLAVMLAFIAFAVARRRPAFYGVRRIAKQDVVAMLKTLAALLALVIVLKELQTYLLPAASGAPDGDSDDLPLVLGLVSAGLAGLTEEFAYRGYLIEELGELSRSRPFAAAISVVAFGFAHVNSGYGWSIDLIYPALYGLALTILYLWRRNLWVCVLLHASQDVVYALFHAS